MIRNAHGVTLTELLIAGTIAAVAAAGIHTALSSTFNIERKMRREGSAVGQNAVALAMIRVAQALEKADRFVLLASNDIQLRIPPAAPADLDLAGQYHWERFKYDGAALNFYPAGDCNNPEPLAGQITSVTFAYKAEGLAPPGGDCLAAGDCNFVEYQVAWNSGPPDNKSQEFRGLVASRHIADSNVDPTATAGGIDSGDQLSTAPPPGPPAPGGC